VRAPGSWCTRQGGEEHPRSGVGKGMATPPPSPRSCAIPAPPCARSRPWSRASPGRRTRGAAGTPASRPAHRAACPAPVPQTAPGTVTRERVGEDGEHDVDGEVRREVAAVRLEMRRRGLRGHERQRCQRSPSHHRHQEVVVDPRPQGTRRARPPPWPGARPAAAPAHPPAGSCRRAMRRRRASAPFCTQRRRNAAAAVPHKDEGQRAAPGLLPVPGKPWPTQRDARHGGHAVPHRQQTPSARRQLQPSVEDEQEPRTAAG
jgi:hypothetical protein